MTTADANGTAASDTLSTKENGASMVNNTIGGIRSGTYIGNKNNNFSGPVARDTDASTIALPPAIDNDINFGQATNVASVGADNNIKDATNNSCLTSRDTSVDLFPPPFQNGTTTECSISHSSTIADIARRTSVMNTGDAVDVKTSILDTASVELVSPPCVVCLTFHNSLLLHNAVNQGQHQFGFYLELQKNRMPPYVFYYFCFLASI